MLRFALIASATLLFLAATSASAQYDYGADYARNGFYLGLSGVAAFEDFKNTGGASIDDSLGLNFRGGYRFHPHLAAEAQFEWIEGFDVSGSSIEFETWTFTGNLKAYLLTSQVQPYALFGMGVMQVEVDLPGGFTLQDEDFVVRVGGGIDVYASENIVLSLEGVYVAAADDLNDFNYVSLGWGFLYRF